MYKQKIRFARHVPYVVVYFIIPVILFIICAAFAIYTVLTYNASFTILPYSHREKDVIVPRQAVLTAGTILHGKIIAKENNLGAIAVRLHNFHGGGVEEDRIIFRLKQQGAKQWYYVQEYTGGQFHELDLFPFGFPVIPDSQGKTYVFEIQSKYGYNLTSLDLTDQNPIVVSQYQFPKGLLLKNKILLESFAIKKIVYQLQNLDVRLLLLIFPIPLLLYLVGLSPLGRSAYGPIAIAFKKLQYNLPGKKIVKFFIQKISIYDAITLVILLIDVIFINGPDETVIIELFILVFLKTIVFKTRDYNEFPAALFFLLLCPLMLAFHYKPAAERAAIWTYVFLFIGTGRLAFSQLIAKEEHE